LLYEKGIINTVFLQLYTSTACIV